MFCVGSPLARSSLRALKRKSSCTWFGSRSEICVFWLGWTGVSGMTPEELFTAALGLGKRWRVAECRFEGEPKRLELRINDIPRGTF